MNGLTGSIDKAAQVLRATRMLVVFTGAGISKESGIPTFRDAPSSLWANFDPEEFASREGFLRKPSLVWKWYQERQKMIGEARPNAGHRAIAEMEDYFDSLYVITQNIDDLHRKAGTKSIIELHGNIFRYKCLDNEHPVLELPHNKETPPTCKCGSLIRPDVVWFGEPLPEESVTKSYSVIKNCNTMLVVGTSGTVYPAASFPSLAKGEGARVIEVNPQYTEITPETDVFIKGTAGEILPRLIEHLKRFQSTEGR